MSKIEIKDLYLIFGNEKQKALKMLKKDKSKEEILKDINPEKPDVPLNKNDAFQKVQKRRVQEKR